MSGFIRHIDLRRDEVEDWEQYPFNIPAVRTLARISFRSPVTFFVGENGSGKSTLIEALAILTGFNPEGGSKHFTTRLRPSESSLHRYLKLTREPRRERTGFFLRAETMFNVSTEAEAYAEYGWQELHEKSHGEAFFWLVMNRFRSNGLYILDEPEAALSPQRQLSLIARIHSLVAEGCQFVVSTHSPLLMAYPGAQILSLGEAGIEHVAYKDTEHFLLTRAFLNRPEAMLRELLRPDVG